MRKRTEGVCERVASERVSCLVRLYLVPGTWYGMGCEGCCETLSESDGFKFPRCGGRGALNASTTVSSTHLKTGKTSPTAESVDAVMTATAKTTRWRKCKKRRSIKGWGLAGIKEERGRGKREERGDTTAGEDNWRGRGKGMGARRRVRRESKGSRTKE